MFRSILLPSLLLAVAQSLTVAPTDDALTLANAVLGDGIDIISASIITPHLASAIFTNGPQGMNEGALFTTGLAVDAMPGGNTLFSTQHGTEGHPLCAEVSGTTATSDATVLTVKVNIPEGFDGFQARVIFSTVDTFLEGEYNDAMGIWIDGVQVASDDRQKVISVESLERGQISPPDSGVAYFGSSPVYTTWGKISPGEHEIKIAICDSGDQYNDSAAFVSIDPCVGSDCSSGVKPPTGNASSSASATSGSHAASSTLNSVVPASISNGHSLPSVTGGVKPPYPTTGAGKPVFDYDTDCEEWETDYETDGSDDEDYGHGSGSGKPNGGKPNGGKGPSKGDSHKPTIRVPGTKVVTVTSTALCTTTTCDGSCHTTVFPTPTIVTVTSTAVVDCETITVTQCPRGRGSCSVKTTTVDLLPIDKPTATPVPHAPKTPSNSGPVYVHPCGSKDCLAHPVPNNSPVTIPAPAHGGGYQAPKPTASLGPVCRDSKCAGSGSGPSVPAPAHGGSGAVPSHGSGSAPHHGGSYGSNPSPVVISKGGAVPSHVPGAASPSGSGHGAVPKPNGPYHSVPMGTGVPVHSKPVSGAASPTGVYSFKPGYTPPVQKPSLPSQQQGSGAVRVVGGAVLAGVVGVVAMILV